MSGCIWTSIHIRYGSAKSYASIIHCTSVNCILLVYYLYILFFFGGGISINQYLMIPIKLVYNP